MHDIPSSILLSLDSVHTSHQVIHPLSIRALSNPAPLLSSPYLQEKMKAFRPGLFPGRHPLCLTIALYCGLTLRLGAVILLVFIWSWHDCRVPSSHHSFFGGLFQLIVSSLRGFPYTSFQILMSLLILPSTIFILTLVHLPWWSYIYMNELFLDLEHVRNQKISFYWTAPLCLRAPGRGHVQWLLHIEGWAALS